MDNSDRKFIETMLNSMAFKIYAQKDIAGEEAVLEYETFVYEKAREIFELYRNASPTERMILGLHGAIMAENFLNEEEKERLDRVEPNRDELIKEFFDKLGLE